MRSAADYLRDKGVVGERLDPADQLLGQIAIDRRFATAEQIAERTRAGEPLAPLLSSEQADEARAIRSRRALKCVPCRDAFLADESLDAQAVRCPQCGAALMRRHPLADDDPDDERVRRVASRIRRYRVKEFIARGGMGSVFRAIHPELGKVVALKVLREDAVDAASVERFRTEALATARLSHPNIVRVLDAGAENGLHYVAMDLVDGRPLEDALGKVDAVRVIEKVARAVAHAHAQGVVHRDLKPSNVLVRPDGEPCVIDFGLARLLDQRLGQTRAGVAIGTPYFMAPEQVSGGAIGPWTDVYALGVMLYRAITGSLPYQGSSLQSVFHAILHASTDSPRRLNPSVHRDLEVICLKALDRDARQRYPNAGALADDLARHLDGEPILARPLSWPAQLVRRARRRPAVAAAIVLAATLAGVVGALVLVQRQRRAEALAMLREQGPLIVELALARRREGRLAEMRDMGGRLEAIRARAPGLAETDHWRGRLLRAMMKDDEALACQESALAKDPSLAAARYERIVLTARRYSDELTRAWRRWLARRSADLSAETARGIAEPDALAIERETPALAEMRQSIHRELKRLSGSLHETAAAIGAVQLWSDGRERGIAVLTEIERRGGAPEEVIETLAVALPFEEQMRRLEAAVDADRGFVRYRLRLGLIAYVCGKLDTARKAYEGALALDPANEEALDGILRVRLARLVPEGAEIAQVEADCEAMVRRRPDHVDAWIGLAQVRSLREDWPGAYWALSEALRVGPNFDAYLRRAIVRTNRAFVASQNGDDPSALCEDAVRDCEEAMRLDLRDWNVWTQRARARSVRAAHRVARGGGDPLPDYATAADDLREALRLRPDDAEALLSVG